MEIYLLREEKEVGPYPADEIRSWLDEGHVSATEFAWTPGLESWVPLNNLLAAEEPVETVAPAPEPLPPPPKATARQKAFLSYMGASFTCELTEEEAEKLTKHVSKDPKLAARLHRWEEDKLEFYPDMFVDEIQARRANRPAYFYKLVQGEGSDCFIGVTKAHCQVLVGYLDVNHPRWDAKLKDAAWHYFFPAIAEKFPQLVHKEWRPKLKYKDGPKVSAELLEQAAEAKARAQRATPPRPYGKLVFALLVLGLAGAGVYGWRHPEKVPTALKEKYVSLGGQLAAFVRGDDAPAPQMAPKKKVATTPGTSSPEIVQPGKEPSVAAGDSETKTVEAKPADPDMKGVSESKPADPAMADKEPKAGDPAMATKTEPKPADPTMADKPEAKPADPSMAETKPDAPAKPTEALFNPKANMTPVAPASEMSAVPGAPTATKGEARITKPVQIPSKYGVVTISTGTTLKVVSHEGEWLTLNHLGQTVRVPVSSTDFGGQ